MAYLPNKNKKKNTQVASSGTSTATPSGSVSTQASAPASTAPAQKQSNTGWTNLNQYLSANKGAGASMGQKIGQKVNSLTSTATQKLNEYGEARSNEAKAQEVDLSDVAKGIKDDPTKVEKKDYEDAVGATYKGPNTFGGGNGYQGVLSSQQDLSKATAGQGSQLNQNLVKSVYDRDSYSRGSKNLDGFLFGQSQSNRDIVTRASKAWQDHQANLSKTQESVNKAISDASGQVAAEVKAVNDAYDEKRKSLKEKIDEANKGLDGKNSDQDEAKNELIRRLKERDGVEHEIDWNGDGKVGGPDDLAVYDSIRGAIDNLDGYDWSKFVNSNKAFGLGDVVDDATQTDWKAILGLTDDTNGYTFTKGGSNAGINMDMVRKAGDYYKKHKELTARYQQNQASSDAENSARTKDYITKSIESGDVNALKAMGFTDTDLASIADYRRRGGNVRDLNWSFNVGDSIGNVASNEEMDYLDQLAQAMGLKTTDRTKAYGKINNIAAIVEHAQNEAHRLYKEAEDRKHRASQRKRNGQIGGVVVTGLPVSL